MDYCLAKNEGHIHCKLHYLNDEVDDVVVGAGSGYMQGIILPFVTTMDDDAEGERTGGFGSTDGKK
jgi:dUTP pyrophosphatase